MLKEAFELRKIRARYVLFDSWHAGADNLKYIHRQGRIFYTTLKSVSDPVICIVNGDDSGGRPVRRLGAWLENAICTNLYVWNGF